MGARRMSFVDEKRWILDLSDLVERDVKPARLRQLRMRVGGKALNLARMASLGLAVPDAFVITTEAFRFGLDRMLRHVPDLRHAAQTLRTAPLPPALAQALAEAYAQLGPDATVAVRSSATDEDGEERSFAGQQATFLNVRGAAAVDQAVRDVWASLFGVESLLYRGRLRLDERPPEMAVVVQRFVRAEVAGVLFTTNPLDSEADEAMICSAYGIGESVVAGHAADTFYIHRKRRTIRRAVRPKTSKFEAADRVGLKLVSLPEDLAEAPSLSEARVQHLLDLGLSLERYFGEAQDIEFAFAPESGALSAGQAEDGLYVLQARTITGRREASLVPGPTSTLYSNANVGEALPGVGTPITWSIIRGYTRRGFDSAFGALGLRVPREYAMVASFRGRVYLNISEFVSVASQIPLLTGETLARLGGVLNATGLEGTYTRMRPGAFLRRLPMTLPRLAMSQFVTPLRAAWWSRRFVHRRDHILQRDLGKLEKHALLDLAHEIDAIFHQTGELMLSCAANFLMSYAVVSRALEVVGGAEAAREETELFSGLTRVRSAAPGLELLALAAYIRARPLLRARFGQGCCQDLQDKDCGEALLATLRESAEGREFLKRLDAFLARWGLRALREADIATPRWREDPSFLLGVLQRHVSAEHLPHPESIEAEQARQRAQATHFIRRHFFPGLGVVFRSLLAWSQAYARLREEWRANVVDSIALYRHFFLEIGRRLVDHNLLCEQEDVFFLTYPEIVAWLEGGGELVHAARRWVAFRRAQYDAFVESPDPPDTFLLTHAQEVQDVAPPAIEGDNLYGLPGSPGVVSGRARVIESLQGAHIPIQTGEILVTTFTDVGWTPLFLLAAAVVTERGGPLSHSCVVAREYGIPAVAGVTGVMQRVANGDLITVDGKAGRVVIHRDASGTAAHPDAPGHSPEPVIGENGTHIHKGHVVV